MNSQRNIAVIAPEKMVCAFSVLIDSTPNQSVLASATNLDELLTLLGEKKPDVVLVYLVREHGPNCWESTYEIIIRTKKIWPDSMCVTIVKYTSQLEKAVENGADLALVDGVSAVRLLAALEMKFS